MPALRRVVHTVKIFLAGTDLLKNYPEEIAKAKYQLASFFNIQEWMIPILNKCEEYLLDSGAFSFMNGKKGEIDFDAYVDRYADFINKHKVKNFFELDVDCVIGQKKTYLLRDKLETLTGRQCIPVWHKSRGLEEWGKICEEYNYVAIGGIVSKEILPFQYKALPAMIDIAHKKGAKVHGLGFTSTSYFHKVKFDTVDSTTWNVGGKFGNVCVFSEKDYMKQRIQKKGKRCIDQKSLMIHNWNEWIKFQKYAEKYL